MSASIYIETAGCAFNVSDGEAMAGVLRRSGYEIAARASDADLVVLGLKGAIAHKTVTYDLERQMEGAIKLKCSEFGKAIVDSM